MFKLLIFPFHQIDGTFRINQPPVLLGYTQENKTNNEELGMAMGDNTCITLFITVEPGLTTGEISKQKVL